MLLMSINNEQAAVFGFMFVVIVHHSNAKAKARHAELRMQTWNKSQPALSEAVSLPEESVRLGNKRR